MMPLLNVVPLLILYMYVVNIIINGVPTTGFVDPLSKRKETDGVALLAIKSMITQDPFGVLDSWNESLHFCQWQGVICGNRHRRVTTLDLSSYGLVGSLSPFVGNLSFLHTLYLYNNTFTGQIPPEVGRLFRLKSLNLVNNSFQGEIPTNISGCMRLLFLQLTNNELVGKLPFGLSFLSKLQNLSLGRNSLTGNDFSPLANLTSLQVLQLSVQNSHGFSGRIPNFIGNFKDLKILALASNSFTGQIPPSLYNLSNLHTLSLSDNILEGALPPDIGFYLPQLQFLQLSDNQLSGPFPFSFSNLTQLVILELYNNNFTGKILFDGRKMPKLSVLDLGAVIIGRGEIDELDFLNTLVNCTFLSLLNAYGNNLGGHIPDSIANHSVLRVLDLNGNLISGSIPSGLGNIVSLERLGLFDNQLTSNIPDDIGRIPRLEWLFLNNNLLSGSIPPSLGNLSWLSRLNMKANILHGFVPSTLGNCRNLLGFYIDQNNLDGNIPQQLFEVSTLVEINLGHNNFQGSLPSAIDKLQNLVALDMSNNNFSGSIPSSFGQCIALKHLNLRGNSLNGPIPQSFSLLKSLEFVDLSNNKLLGQVPKYFSSFSSLEYLNLSFNNLEGDIPTRGIFANVSALFLNGNNKLCGGISQLKLPTCQMTKPKVKRKSRALVIAISVSCFLTGLIIVSFAYLACTKRKQETSSLETMNKTLFVKVSYDMLLKATNGFSLANLIGSGSFSSVYKGNLLLNGTQKFVAIKVINNQRQGSSQSFLAECEALRVIRHRNLVGVVTACSSMDFQGNVFNAIVYDLMENGSLESWLYAKLEDNDHQFRSLSLLQRLNIAIDVAHALYYIHNVCKTPIVHCDLKPTNILLDNDLMAHLGDFGLVKLPLEITNEATNYSSLGVRGTIGYAAPEYGLGGSVSAAGDVYSYGIVLLELMTAKKPTDVMFEGDMSLPNFAKSALPDGVEEIIDPKLQVNNVGKESIDLENTGVITKCALECITSMIMIGLSCSSELPQDRMDIKDAINQLEFQKHQLLGGRYSTIDAPYSLKAFSL